MNKGRGLGFAVIDDKWRAPGGSGRGTIDAEAIASATYDQEGGPQVGITFLEADRDTIDARRLHLHLKAPEARRLADSLIGMAESAEEMEQAERRRQGGKPARLPDWVRDATPHQEDRPALGADEYGNPSTMIEVWIGGRVKPARAVHIPIGGRYGLKGCKVADEPMIEIQPWAGADTWRGAGFRWTVDVLNGRSKWASRKATRDGLCVHGGSVGGHDPLITADAEQMARIFRTFNLDTNPNNEKEGS